MSRSAGTHNHHYIKKGVPVTNMVTVHPFITLCKL